MCLLDLATLSTAASPEEFLTVSLWRYWMGRIDSRILSRPVVELAEMAQVELPHGEWGTLAHHASGFPFQTVSKEKRRSLILLVATLAQARLKQRLHPLDNPPSVERLVSKKDVTKLVSDDEWSAWCQMLNACDTKDRLVAEIAAELGLPWPFSRRTETIANYLGLMPKEICAIPGIGRKKYRTIVLCTAQAVQESYAKFAGRDGKRSDQIGAGGDFAETHPSDRTTVALVQELLGRLKKRERQVIELRFGLYGQEPHKLADLAEQLGVTRQRILQIESKVINKLRLNSSLLTKLRHSLDEQADVIWNDLSAESEAILSDISDTELVRKLNSTHQISFAICDLSISTFLDGIATRVSRGWYRSTVDRFLVERVIFQLEHDEGGPFPSPTEVVARRVDAGIGAVRIAVAFSSNIKNYKGYVWKGPLGRQGRRSIMLHRILASMSGRTFIDTSELVSIHNRIRPYSACSYRDAEMSMARFGHLFVQIGKGAWVAAGGVPLPSVGEVDPDDTVQSDQGNTSVEFDPGSAAGAIAQILAEFGPLPMSEIVDHVCVRTNFQASSVGPILLTRGGFLRMAPGIYGLTQHLSDMGAREKARRLLLSEGACAEFIRAVRAGEKRAKFPLWNARMEHEWCVWARDNATTNIYASLLVVVEPEQWTHVPMEERIRWQRRKNVDSCYQIDGAVSFARPAESVVIADLLAPIYVASRQGHLGWVTINHVHGKRQNDSRALAYLGLLVAAGVVHAQNDWRLPHIATDDADELCENLLEALYRDGRVRWDSRMGELLRDRIMTGLNQHQGWVTQEIGEALHLLLPVKKRESRFATEALVRATVELGIAIASADGEIGGHELNRVRDHASMSVRDLGTEGASLVECFIKETLNNMPDAIAVAKEIRGNMSISQQQSLMTHLFMIAAEGGVFHEAEGRLLVRIQKSLDIDPDHFEMLYRSHAKDPRAATLLSEKLRKQESRENIEDLVSLLML